MRILFGEFEYEPGELFDGMGNEVTLQTPHALDYVSDAILTEINDFRKQHTLDDYQMVIQYAFIPRYE